MKKKVVSILAAATVAASLLGGAAPLTVLADGTMVVSIGADLTEDQKSAILKYFGIYGNNSVQTITVTNQDERSHLASYIPIEQIGLYYQQHDCIQFDHLRRHKLPGDRSSTI